MADLRVRISAPTYNGRPTADQRFAGVNDANPSQITQTEAQQALEVVDRFKAANQGMQDNQIQVRVGDTRATVSALRRIAGVQAQAPTPPPAPPVTAPASDPAAQAQTTPAPAPQGPVAPAPQAQRPAAQASQQSPVNPNGITFRASVAPATVRGLEGANLWNSNAWLAWNRILAQGSAGSFRLNLGAGAIWNQGDGNLIANFGGPQITAGLEGEIRPGNGAFAFLFGGNVSGAYLFGRSQIPGRADWTHLNQGLTVAAQGCAGARIYVSAGTSIDACWAPTLSFTPSAVQSVGGDSRDIFASSLLGFTLGVSSHSVASTVQVAGATICAEVGRTPESMRARIEELRPAIASLRQENARLRTEMTRRYPSMNLNNIAGYEPIVDNNQDETRAIPEDCEGLNNLLNALESRADALAEQNARLQGLGSAPASAVPAATRAITRLQEIHFATARPQGAPDRVTDARANIATIDSAVQGYLSSHPADANGNRTPLTVNEIEELFRGIFVRTRRNAAQAQASADAGAPDMEYSPSIEVIQHIAEDLKTDSLRNLDFYIVGNTDTRGDDAMNGRLSLRRAASIRAALILLGVNPDRLHAIGRGENNTVYYYDQDHGHDPHRITQAEIRMLRRDGIRGPIFRDEVALRLVTNRRVEMYICDPSSSSDAICTNLRSEFQAANPSDAGVSPSGRTVQTIGADGGTPADASAH